MIHKAALRLGMASLWQLAVTISRPPRATIVTGDAGDANDASAVTPFLGTRRPWLSVPLATAVVAGLVVSLLLADLVSRLAPAPRTAVATAKPVTAVAPPAPPTALPELAMPEPAAGPASGPFVESPSTTTAPTPAPRHPAWTPVVADVPLELDDIVRELLRRRAELLELEAGLALREAALRAAEADLSAQIDRLEAFRRELQALVGDAEAEEEERLQQLVKMYESMRAKSAAAIFDRLEMPVILSVARRMREARMAAILAAMDPNRARIVTSELARERELPRLD
jgi:hypothetical protein